VSNSPAIEIAALKKEFDGLLAVDSIHLTVQRGEMFALVGPDGAGKTTTVRMLTGILPSSGGTASVLGTDIGQRTDEVKRKIGYLSQRFSLYGDLSIDENIEFFADIHGVSGYRERREELLRFMRLTPFRDRLADRLSGGMRQKLALACTLIHTPELLFLDEPTTGVDPLSRRDFWVILQTLVRDGMTILLTTPYLDEAERCSRVALMSGGTIMKVGTPSELRKDMPGEVIEIVCAPVRKGFERLRESGLFRSVQAFGDRVNVVTRRDSPKPATIREQLEEAGIDVQDIRMVRPSLENVFISLLSRQEVEP